MSALHIDMMREFCTRFCKEEDIETAIEEIQKIMDSTLIHIGRHLSETDAPAEAKPAEAPKPVAKKAAKKSDSRCKCEGKNKKGEACRFYALEGMKHCKSHQVLESDGEEKPKRKKLVANKKVAEDEYLGGIKKVVLEFFEHNKGKKLSDLKFSLVRKFVSDKGIEVSNNKLLQDITTEVIQDLKLTEASSQPDEDPETDEE